MIQVNEKNFFQIEYLLNQSAQGNHILFASDQIQKAYLEKVVPLDQDHLDFTTQLFEKLIRIESIEKQKAWLQSLPENKLHLLIKIYLNIVENRLFDNETRRH